MRPSIIFSSLGVAIQWQEVQQHFPAALDTEEEEDTVTGWIKWKSRQIFVYSTDVRAQAPQFVFGLTGIL